MGLQNCECNEKDEIRAVIVRPENLPETENLVKGEFTLESDEDPSRSIKSVKSIEEESIERDDVPKTEEQV